MIHVAQGKESVGPTNSLIGYTANGFSFLQHNIKVLLDMLVLHTAASSSGGFSVV